MAEALDDGLVGEAAAPPKKKSLFSKSTWAKPVAQKEGIEFFSRADELWPSRLAEEERKRQKKATKLERKRSSASAERNPSSTPDSKKRRVSQNEEHEHHSSEGSLNHEDPDKTSRARRESTLSTPGSRKSNSSSRRKPQASPVSLSKSDSRGLYAKGQEVTKSEKVRKSCISLSDSDNEARREISSGSTEAINLDDDDDDVVAISSKPAVRIEEDPNMSDEEFPELARQARQREKQKELERLKAGHSFENQNRDTNGSNTPVHVVVDDIFEEQPTILEDPVVEILVTSRIEGTNPLVVRRKLSQKLREVRLIWCDKQSISGQPLSINSKDPIILTWRGKKLFDLTTCKSLGLRIDGNDHLYSDGEGFMEGKIHLEAWTLDLYERNKHKLAAEQDRGGSEDELEPVEHAVERKVKLIMKAKDMEPLRIQVKPTTTIGKMASTFRGQRGVPDAKDISLYFDGDKLSSDSTVEDVELADMDNVEVHIR